MISIFKKQNGMSIVGQGGKIILFMLPSLIAAILVQTYLPQIAALPESISFIKPVGYLLLLLGLILWGAVGGNRKGANNGKGGVAVTYKDAAGENRGVPSMNGNRPLHSLGPCLR